MIRLVVFALTCVLLPFQVLAAGGAGGRLRGEVSSVDRLGIAGATVIARRVDAPLVLGLTSTNERGSLALNGLPAGRYDIVVDAEGYLRGLLKGLPVRPPYRAVADLVLAPGNELGQAIALAAAEGSSALELRVVDASGAPLSGVRCRLDPLEHRADPVELSTSDEGIASAEQIPAGTWKLTLFRAGLARLRIARLVWSGGPLQIVARMLPLPEQAPVPLEDLMPSPGV